jgi:hypothetical protein
VKGALRFNPSDELLSLIQQSAVGPAPEAVKAQKLVAPTAMVETWSNKNLRPRFADAIEGFFENLAQCAANERRQQVQLSDGTQFTREACDGLVYQLGLDLYSELGGVFSQLHRELLEHGRRDTGERRWGYIVYAEGGLGLEVNLSDTAKWLWPESAPVKDSQ